MLFSALTLFNFASFARLVAVGLTWVDVGGLRSAVPWFTVPHCGALCSNEVVL